MASAAHLARLFGITADADDEFALAAAYVSAHANIHDQAVQTARWLHATPMSDAEAEAVPGVLSTRQYDAVSASHQAEQSKIADAMRGVMRGVAALIDQMRDVHSILGVASEESADEANHATRQVYVISMEEAREWTLAAIAWYEMRWNRYLDAYKAMVGGTKVLAGETKTIDHGSVAANDDVVRPWQMIMARDRMALYKEYRRQLTP